MSSFVHDDQTKSERHVACAQKKKAKKSAEPVVDESLVAKATDAAAPAATDAAEAPKPKKAKKAKKVVEAAPAEAGAVAAQ